MRKSSSLGLLVCFLLFALNVAAQQTPSSPPASSTQASSLLQQSLAAQTGATPANDLTLSGTISFPHSAQTGTYPVTLIALANGTSQMVTNLPTGKVTHVWNNGGSTPALSVTGPSGTTQALAIGQNTLMPTGGWFSPAVLVGMMSGAGYSASDAGLINLNGSSSSLHHLILTQGANGSQPQTQSDLYLDPSTTLPVMTVFQVNPYYSPGTSKPASPHAAVVPEEIRYSNY
jgi:hypothetical protein